MICRLISRQCYQTTRGQSKTPPLLSYLILAHSPLGCSLTPCCSLDIQVETRASLFPLCRYAGVWVGVRHWNYDWLPRNRPLALPLITTRLLLTQWYVPPIHVLLVDPPWRQYRDEWAHIWSVDPLMHTTERWWGVIWINHVHSDMHMNYNQLKTLLFFLSFPNPNLQTFGRFLTVFLPLSHN